MTFTDTFNQTSQVDRPDVVAAERQKRTKDNTDQYVAVPIAIPDDPGYIVAANVGKYRLAWAIGTPGIVENDAGNPARMCLTLGMPNEEVATDFCDVLNQARHVRKVNKDTFKS